MQLGDIAHVKTGLVLSRKKSEIQYDKKATYNLITIKNIDDNGMIYDDTFEQFDSNDILDEHYFTKNGDVLMRLSQPYTAVYIDEVHTGLLIPSYFAIIKVHDSNVLPQYLAWYLNSSKVKKELERFQWGSRIPGTNQSAIRKLPIELAPIAKQKRLMELYHLHQKEMMLYQKLIKEKKLLFQGVTEHILGGEKNG